MTFKKGDLVCLNFGLYKGTMGIITKKEFEIVQVYWQRTQEKDWQTHTDISLVSKTQEKIQKK